MTKLLRTPRSSLAFLCGILGTFLLFGQVNLDGRAAVTAIVASAEENADQTVSREAAALAQRGLHLSKVGVELWHKKGFRGKGVKVAVLDSGFRGWRDHVGKSLPDTVKAKSFRYDGDLEARNSQHGILCAEVIHALAPDAEILLANWEADSPERFLDAVRWAREQGAQIISCSVIMPSWSDGEGGGPIHEKLARILGGDNRDDVLCFASAGNTAKRHWGGVFKAGADGFHAWKMGVTDNALAPWGDDRVSVEVCWKDEADFLVQIEDATTHRIVAQSSYKSGARNSTQARFEPSASRAYVLRVMQTKGKPCAFHCVALASGLEYSTPAGSVCFPADGPAVIAVGAVDADTHRMIYSSCGPNSAKPKPDLVAMVPFPSLWRDRPFSGTSAASPQAAALAALYRCRYPNWTANEVRKEMCERARDLLSPGHDNETGFGLIQLPTE